MWSDDHDGNRREMYNTPRIFTTPNISSLVNLNSKSFVVNGVTEPTRRTLRFSEQYLLAFIDVTPIVLWP